MNYLEEIRALRHNYECQCKENGRKQDIIIELKRKIREMEEKISKLENENKLLKDITKGGKK